MVKKIGILAGQDKEGNPEEIKMLEVQAGEVLAVVGPTGSGKTQLISDIEQYAAGETPSRRHVLINGLAAGDYDGLSLRRLVAEVSQNMNFVIDMSVEEFLLMHAQIREIKEAKVIVKEVIRIANVLAGEPLLPGDNITVLSGGQSRALMVADVALISNAPVVLIDEVENAGINRLQAMDFLAGRGKVVMVVTHDPMLSLMADRRVVMKNGGMLKLQQTTPEEKEVLKQLIEVDKELSGLRDTLRQGGTINKKNRKTLQEEVLF